MTTNEYNPRFKDLLSAANAQAGGRTNGLYRKGFFKGKSNAQLIEMVKAAYRKKYGSRQYYVRYLVENKGGEGSSNIASVQAIQAEIEAIQKQLKSGVVGEGSVPTDDGLDRTTVTIRLSEADRARLEARIKQLRLQLASLTNGSE